MQQLNEHSLSKFNDAARREKKKEKIFYDEKIRQSSDTLADRWLESKGFNEKKQIIMVV